MTITEKIISEIHARRLDGKDDPASKERSYIMEYRYLNRVGQAKGTTEKRLFWFKGDLANARIRARQHCEKMNYRYITVSPFIVDLDAIEKSRGDSEGTEEND